MITKLSYNFFILAICNKTCQNGGECVAPDICSCPPNFSGPQCTAGNIILEKATFRFNLTDVRSLHATYLKLQRFYKARVFYLFIYFRVFDSHNYFFPKFDVYESHHQVANSLQFIWLQTCMQLATCAISCIAIRP